MPAHLMPLPKCQTCGGAASEALRNTHNAIIGYFCKRHANAALKRYRAEHEDR